MIDLKNVSASYKNGTEALKNVTLHIEKGEFVFIVGPSGAGKSTLTKTLFGEIKPDSGEVMVNDYDLMKIKRSKLPYFRRTIGIVFQDFRLVPTMTVFENIAFVLRITKTPIKLIRKRVGYIINLLGLGGKEKSYPQELSGGEQQRVALGRALVNNPKIIIADEPTGNIDPERSREIIKLLTEINKMGTTIVMVTHEHDLVSEFNHRTVMIKDGNIISDTGAVKV